MIFSDPAARAARAAEKKAKVLSFLASEVWTSATILGQVAGLTDRGATHRLATGMEAVGLIRRAPAPILAGQGVTLWGITTQGRALCPAADPAGPIFEPSKISVVVVPHQLALQALRLRCEAAGWTDWTRGERLGAVDVRPDVLARRPGAAVPVALEYERSIKTAKRYQSIISAHLRAISAGQWAGVYYICPPAIAAGLERLFAAIRALPGGVPFDQARRQKFKIVVESKFPPPIVASASAADTTGAVAPLERGHHHA
jgi:hypothetical protein